MNSERERENSAWNKSRDARQTLIIGNLTPTVFGFMIRNVFPCLDCKRNNSGSLWFTDWPSVCGVWTNWVMEWLVIGWKMSWISHMFQAGYYCNNRMRLSSQDHTNISPLSDQSVSSSTRPASFHCQTSIMSASRIDSSRWIGPWSLDTWPGHVTGRCCRLSPLALISINEKAEDLTRINEDYEAPAHNPN